MVCKIIYSPRSQGVLHCYLQLSGGHLRGCYTCPGSFNTKDCLFSIQLLSPHFCGCLICRHKDCVTEWLANQPSYACLSSLSRHPDLQAVVVFGEPKIRMIETSQAKRRTMSCIRGAATADGLCRCMSFDLDRFSVCSKTQLCTTRNHHKLL